MYHSINYYIRKSQEGIMIMKRLEGIVRFGQECMAYVLTFVQIVADIFKFETERERERCIPRVKTG